MSQQSDMADRIRTRLKIEPVPVSDMVREIREAWGPSHSVGAVHGFIREVTTCLLDHDVEVGDFVDGRFVSWDLEPWDADEKIDHELMSMDAFLEDGSRYVFRTK